MKTSLATITGIVLAHFNLATGQPVLTEENTLGPLIGLSVDFSTFDATSPEEAEHLVEMTGMDQTWDVSTLSFEDPVVRTMRFTDPNPFMPNAQDPRLADANLVAVSHPDGETWMYQRFDGSGQYLLGGVTLRDVNQDGRRDTLVTTFDPASTVFPFPLTMGTAWSDSTTQTLEFEGSPPVPVETVVASHVVEGWGTIVSPDGTAPALRIRTDARVTSSGGQRTTRRTIRVVTPVPDGLLENTAYTAYAEMLLDSLDALLELSYVSLSAYRPTHTELEEPLAREVDLGPTYPNPFRTTTTIPFSIVDPGEVRIRVFDIVGRHISEVLNEKLHSGIHRVTWDARNVPSGIYRILLETRDAAASRLVVVVK